MLNKLFLIFLFISFNVFTCVELNNLNIYSQDTKTISLEYIQSFEGINKTNVEGQVYFEKPNHFLHEHLACIELMPYEAWLFLFLKPQIWILQWSPILQNLFH